MRGIILEADGPGQSKKQGYVYVLWEGPEGLIEERIADLTSIDGNPFISVPQPSRQSSSTGSPRKFTKERLKELADIVAATNPNHPQMQDFLQAVDRCPDVPQMLNDVGEKLTMLINGDQDGLQRQMQSFMDNEQPGYHPSSPPISLNSSFESPSVPSQPSPPNPVHHTCSQDYPAHSILKYYGKRESRPFCRGDIVQRVTGPSSRGLIEGINASGDKLWVLWLNGDRNYCAPVDLKVVDRIKQINIGDIVERGPDWRGEVLGDQDGGTGSVGIVTKFGDDKEVFVLWGN
jgi:hypothetical protein